MSFRVTDVGSRYVTGLPAEKPPVERRAPGSDGAATASATGAAEAAAPLGTGERGVSRESVRKYLEALAIKAGKDLTLPGAYGRQLDRVCRECRDAGIPENTVSVMRYAVGRKLREELQKRGVG